MALQDTEKSHRLANIKLEDPPQTQVENLRPYDTIPSFPGPSTRGCHALNQIIQSPLRSALIDAYRAELQTRYSLQNVRQFDEFSDVSDDKIKALRDFFLDHIYPPSEKRALLDDAFDNMGTVITSPRRLKPLMGAVFKSLWTIARMFPAAVKTGVSTLEAYLETRRLEKHMLEYAERHEYTPEDLSDRKNIVAIVAGLPDGEVMKFLSEVIRLFKSLSNVKLLTAARDIMERSIEVMESRPDLYDEHEVAGLQLGHEIIAGGVELFSRLEPEEFPVVIKGIETIERDWYDQILEEADDE